MTTTTTVYPATVQALIRTALDRGISPADLLEELYPVTPSTTPPAGYVQQPDALQPDVLGGVWYGPTFEGSGWKITTQWVAEEGATFYLDGTGGDSPIPSSQAGRIAVALAQVAKNTRPVNITAEVPATV